MPFNDVMLLRLEVRIAHAEKLTIRQRRGLSMFRRNDITRMGELGTYPPTRRHRQKQVSTLY